MAYYLTKKGVGHKGQVFNKAKSETFLTQDQVDSILMACEKARDNFNPRWKRDYAMIYLGYMFALRVGEVIILERRQFEHIEDLEVAYIPTLKRSERVPYHCAICGKTARVRSDRIGKEFPCPRCMKINIVKCPSGFVASKDDKIPEIDPPVIEGQVVSFVADYIKNWMRPDQRWLFESKRDRHMTVVHALRIFNTYAYAAGLSNKYSWHALRHGRGVKLWNAFKDLKLVADGLRHRGMRTAERYTHLDPETVRGYKEKLEKNAINPKKRFAK